MTNETNEHCNTQFAAPMRSDGMFIFVLRNHTPNVSAKTSMTSEIPICMFTLVVNIRFSLSKSPCPSSYIIKRLMEEDNELDITENIITTPPTTL